MAAPKRKFVARPRMGANVLIGHLLDRPSWFVVKTMTRRGPIWTLSNLALIEEAACLNLIAKGALVERDPGLVEAGNSGGQTYTLSTTYRNRAARG